MDEQSLIERCRQQDRQAQRILYERTVDRVYRLLLRMTGNPDAAADLTQETYVRAFSRLDQFRGDASIETWLHRVAANEALQFFRRRQAEQRHRAAWAERPATAEATPSADVRMDVNEALSRLEPAERLLLLLRYDQGLDYRAIASVLDCAEGTVASRLNRARSRMRELLPDHAAAQEETPAQQHPTIGPWTNVQREPSSGKPQPSPPFSGEPKASRECDGDNRQSS